MQPAPIEIVDYNPLWVELFAAEQQLIASALSAWLVGEPQHVGSTAVVGLAAKPIIDIMAPVASLEASRPAIEAAQRIGFVHFPYKPDVMHWFCKPNPAARTHHLHLFPISSPRWHEQLAFRDALRTNPSLRQRYQALKQSLAHTYRTDREAYTEAKAPFIEQALRQFKRQQAAS
jgi:GrpB-like predicted nucleotidyltransferase (UPF0157 family)